MEQCRLKGLLGTGNLTDARVQNGSETDPAGPPRKIRKARVGGSNSSVDSTQPAAPAQASQWSTSKSHSAGMLWVR